MYIKWMVPDYGMRGILNGIGRFLFGENDEVHYIGGAEVLPPPLDAGEESVCIRMLATDAAEEARRKLIEHNLRLVVYIAKKFDNTGVGVEDLISIGTIGLIKAINTFNPDKNIKLATYASRCIENEILMYLRRNSKTRLEVSIDEPLNVDWDGNELLLSDILGTDEDVIYRDIETDVERTLLMAELASVDYIEQIFDEFMELHGDRQFRDDPAIVGGVAYLDGQPVTVIGVHKGKDLKECMHRNYGMPSPEGYRKALRLMKQAEKFDRPIITFIDTPGAYPGKDAEERGQGEAIARNLMEMSGLTVPVIAVVTGEGSSGGALALGVANRILMLENAVYSVLSPEGFASILWKDSSRSGEACEIMKLTAQDLYKDGIVEEIIPEPVGGAQRAHGVLFGDLDEALRRQLRSLARMNGRQLAEQRYQKFRQIGEMRKA
mgnify:CR=1 FL=1